MFCRPVRRRNHADDSPLILLPRTSPISATVGNGQRPERGARTGEGPGGRLHARDVQSLDVPGRLAPLPYPYVSQALTSDPRSYAMPICQLA